MSKKLILGIAAGAAAVVAVGYLLKRTGALDSILDKLGDIAEDLEDRFANLESFGMHDVIPKGEDRNVSKQLTETSHN